MIVRERKDGDSRFIIPISEQNQAGLGFKSQDLIGVQRIVIPPSGPFTHIKPTGLPDRRPDISTIPQWPPPIPYKRINSYPE